MDQSHEKRTIAALQGDPEDPPPDHHPERRPREPLAVRAVADADRVRVDRGLEGNPRPFQEPIKCSPSLS